MDSHGSLRRIIVIGTSGAGKTTLAKQLAGILGHEHIELDALYWGPGWTPRANFSELVDSEIARPYWVIDGNYGPVRERIWRRATAIVWLNYSFATVFTRALVRTLRRILYAEELYAGNRETFCKAFLARDGIPWWVIRTYQRRKRQYRSLLREPEMQHLRVIELKRPSQADDFLQRAKHELG